MTIAQTTPIAITEWTDFSVASGQTVTITQPDATSILVLRVTATSATAIAGNLTSNGRVILLNPNGIFFSGVSTVATSGFLASTGDIDNADVVTGLSMPLGVPAASTAAITAQGSITALGHTVALVAAQVELSGIIAASGGDVLLASVQAAGIAFDQPSATVNVGFAAGSVRVTPTGAVTDARSITVRADTADGTTDTSGGSITIARTLSAPPSTSSTGDITVEAGAGIARISAGALADSTLADVGARLNAGAFVPPLSFAYFDGQAQLSSAGTVSTSTAFAAQTNLANGLLQIDNARVTCSTNESGELVGSAVLSDLSSSGTAVPPLSSLDLRNPNVAVDIAGLGHIVFNEQSSVHSGGMQTLTVTGIHLTTEAGDEARLFQASCSRAAVETGPGTPTEQETLPAAGVDATVPGFLAFSFVLVAGVLLLARRRDNRI